MKVFIGLEDLCPTEEHIYIQEIPWPFPMMVPTPAGFTSHYKPETYPVHDMPQLEEWADATFEIWCVREVGGAA